MNTVAASFGALSSRIPLLHAVMADLYTGLGAMSFFGQVLEGSGHLIVE